MSTTPEYLSCAETATLVRRSLKQRFPGTRFSVRSKTYSGGASITVDWTDGPSKDAVEAIAKKFEGSRFDGSIDLAYDVEHWLLPDGSAVLARDPGSTGSMGGFPAQTGPAVEWAVSQGARRVSFGAHYIFCERSLSIAARCILERAGRDAFGIDAPAAWQLAQRVDFA